MIHAGDLDGTAYETSDIVTIIEIFDPEYVESTTETDFDVGYMPEGGIFTTLAGITGKAYFTNTMDSGYLLAHSGQKTISNAVRVCLLKYGQDVADLPIRVLTRKGIYELATLVELVSP